MLGVERRESPCRCPGGIQGEMLASTVGYRHPVADDGVVYGKGLEVYRTTVAAIERDLDRLFDPNRGQSTRE